MSPAPIESHPLNVIGVGCELVDNRSVREEVLRLGGDVSDYKGWERFSVAPPEVHPSTLGARALEQALQHAQCTASDLRLIVWTGSSRDYLPPWSLSTELARRLQAPSQCVCIDTIVGCLGILTALEIAQGWLAKSQGGCAAVVAAEKWSQTIDRSSRKVMSLWGYGDGAGALILSADGKRPSIASYRGAQFVANHEYNDLIVPKYGGTQFPRAPSDEEQSLRSLGPYMGAEIYKTYLSYYSKAFSKMREAVPYQNARLICNQISPSIVNAIGQSARVDRARICVTGNQYGHLGGSDILVGIMTLLERREFEGTILIGASTPYCFGAACLEAAKAV